jgi:hypothetical protein
MCVLSMHSHFLVVATWRQGRLKRRRESVTPRGVTRLGGNKPGSGGGGNSGVLLQCEQLGKTQVTGGGDGGRSVLVHYERTVSTAGAALAPATS